MKILNYNSFNEAWYDIFKSKQPKRLTFNEDETQYITDSLSNLVTNFDLQHSNGEVTSKFISPKKAKKEYIIIDLYSKTYYDRRRLLHLQCFKTRFYEDGQFVVMYHFGGDIVGGKTKSLENYVKELKRVIVAWKISNVLLVGGLRYEFEKMSNLIDEYNVLRDGKIIEFRFREMIDEVFDRWFATQFKKSGGIGKFKTSPFKKYEDEQERIINRLKEMNLEFI